jgi:signal transduction histidine kinase/CheY-like chemotaxis protein
MGRYDLALKHYQAFKRLDDQARDLMVNTNSALMAAQFDFANQDLKIARLQADQLKKDAELARSRNRIILIVLGGLALTLGLLGFNFLSLRRSSRKTTKANTQLSQANQALETALKARSEFLATTSHEIRTPLNGILGVTQVLLSDPGLSADVRDRISLMNGAGETMRAMVNDLLDMAKIESGTLTIEKGETDLNGLLDDAVRLWTDKAREKGLDLVIDRSAAPGRILEDGPRLRQVVFNLLSNAIKFTEAGSVRLTVGVEPAETGERLLLRVTDTGIGIPSDKLDAIFESFQQVDGGVTRRFEGTGLGLSISRRLAEAMGGTLGVESQLGEGSTFTLILPLVRAGAAAAAGAGASGGVFLIIEANPLTQSVLKSIVAPLGLPIETAASPEAAAEVLATGHVSALLVDAAALGPDRTARTAAIARLVAAGAHGMAVTWPSPEPEDIEAALAAGAVKVIAKPISAARLTEALKTLLPESA